MHEGDDKYKLNNGVLVDLNEKMIKDRKILIDDTSA
jgi:hypothetical protein